MAALAPGVESLCYLAIQQAELQRNIGGVEAFRKLVPPSELLRRPDLHRVSSYTGGTPALIEQTA
jgi:hypothetical protein